jgi:hypothetical protein
MKGSRYCLQRYVNEKPGDLADRLISASPTLTAFDPVRVDWKSPLAGHNYQEYRDDFLDVLGLQQHEAVLREYWPLQGPQWDGLALLPTETTIGVLLVEAKAHPGETESTCGATDPASIATIENALARVQSHMGVTPGVTPSDWMKSSYQLANRLALLYFLNEIARVPAAFRSNATAWNSTDTHSSKSATGAWAWESWTRVRREREPDRMGDGGLDAAATAGARGAAPAPPGEDPPLCER